MKIVVLDGYTANPGDISWESWNCLGEVTVYDRTAPSELLGRAEGADAILTNKVIISKETMQQLPSLKYIGVLATGYNVVDIPAKPQISPECKDFIIQCLNKDIKLRANVLDLCKHPFVTQYKERK